jgi:hypothetical protein
LADPTTHAGKPFKIDSLACHMGLVFRADLGAVEDGRRTKLDELTLGLNGAKITQRTEPGATDIASTPDWQPIGVFNPPERSFAELPPQFERRVNYAHEGTVALDWELKWPNSQVRADAVLIAKLGTGSNLDKPASSAVTGWVK